MPPVARFPIKHRVPLAGYKFSTNKIYAGAHWSKRKSAKDGLTGVAKIFCRPIERIGSYPVAISYRFHFVGKPLDTLNCATMAKMLEDAFRSIGILEDDDPAHVARSIIEVDVVNSNGGTKASHASLQEGGTSDEDYVDITITAYASTET